MRPTTSSKITDLETHLDELSKKKKQTLQQRISTRIDLLLDRKQDELQQTQDAYSLYYNARNVFTSLKLFQREQDQLFHAGRTVVENNRETLELLLKAQQPQSGKLETPKSNP